MMNSLTKHCFLPVAALGLALVGGCSGSSPELDPPVQETTGLLGNGAFRWVCVTPADPTCGTGVFPTAIAVGASFDLEFTGSVELPDDLGLITLEPVSPTRLVRVNASLEGQLDGDVSMVALGGGYGIDYVPLTFRTLDDLELGEPEPEPDDPCDDDANSDGVCDGTGGVVTDPGVELVLGELTEVRVRALGGGEALAGAIEYTWESLTPELVEITYTSGRSARISVLGLGAARLSVRAGDYVEVFEYEVQEAPPEPEDTETHGNDDTSSDDTSATGDDTGSGSGGAEGSGSESGSASESGGASESGTSGDTDGTTTTGGV